MDSRRSTSGSPGCDRALGILPEDRRKTPAFNGGGAAGGTAGISGHAGLLSRRQSGRISGQRWRAQYRYLHDDGGWWKISPTHQRSRRLLPGLVARRPADRLHPLRRQNSFHRDHSSAGGHGTPCLQGTESHGSGLAWSPDGKFLRFPRPGLPISRAPGSPAVPGRLQHPPSDLRREARSTTSPVSPDGSQLGSSGPPWPG